MKYRIEIPKNIYDIKIDEITEVKFKNKNNIFILTSKHPDHLYSITKYNDVCIDADLYEITIIERIDQDPNKMILIINAKLISYKLYDKIKQRKPIVNRGKLIFELLTMISNKSINIGTLIKFLSKPTKYPFLEDFNDKKYPLLMQYQICNVDWMEDIENRTPIELEWMTDKQIKIINKSRTDKIFYYSQLNAFTSTPPEVKKTNLLGGALIDEMGTGKTACMITLITKDLEPPLTEKIITDDGFIKNNATLIFMPNHICKQWKVEFSKFGVQAPNRKLKIISITEAKQYIRYANRDILDADIVLIPYQFLQNKIMLTIFEKCSEYMANRKMLHTTYLDTFGMSANPFHIYVNENVGDEHILDQSFNPYLFKWKRIIVDEYQQITFETNKRKCKIINSLKSKYRWCITGTPFPNTTSLSHIIGFLNEYRDVNSVITNRYFIKNLVQNKLFRRNTKDSTKHETNLNHIKLNQNTEWITFTQQERFVYESHRAGKQDELFLRQFCCCPFTPHILNNCNNFTELIEKMYNHYKKNLNISEKSKDELTRVYIHWKNQYENALNENLPNNIIVELEVSTENARLRLQKIEQECESIKRSINYYKNLETKLKSKEELNCPICYLPMDETVQIVMTKCGHLFCQECILQFRNITKNDKCPTCRVHLKKEDIYVVLKQNENENADHAKLRDSVGSKMASIILKIKNILSDPENYIIIFSEWENILSRLRNTLEHEKIKTTICKGNRLVRESAIRRFNEDKNYRVIMLCSQYASHGTNLTKANKVIFINPVGGTPKEREDIESQAIARCYRLGQQRDLEIIRFVIKDTIEEQIYRKTIDQN